MSPRQQEFLGIVLGAIFLGSMLVSFHQPEYSPLPAVKVLTIIAGLIVGGCLGLISATLGRAMMGTLGMTALAAVIQIGIQSLGVVTTFNQELGALVVVYIQQAAVGIGILIPTTFIGAFMTSIVD